MKIVVCIKQVPDTTVVKRLDPQTMRLDREVVAVPNPFDEYAVEAALQLVEQHGGSVVAVCLGPAKASESLRRVLAMGVERAILVTDPGLAGADTQVTAAALAAALKQEEFDLVLCGQESTDARTGVVPARLAEFLGLPQVTFVRQLAVEGGTVKAERLGDGAAFKVEAPLPCLVSVLKGINEPRYPALKGIMAAKKKEIREVPLASLANDLPLQPQVEMLSLQFPEARASGQVLEAGGRGGQLIADYLQTAKII